MRFAAFWWFVSPTEQLSSMTPLLLRKGRQRTCIWRQLRIKHLQPVIFSLSQFQNTIFCLYLQGDEGGLIKCRVFRDPDNTSGGHGWSVRYTQVGQRVFFHFSLYSSIYTFCLFYKAFIFLFFSLMFLGNLVSPFNWEIILIILICNFSFFNCSHIIKSAIDQPTL